MVSASAAAVTEVPGDGLSVEGEVLKIASGTVSVAEATSCTLVAEDGVVTNIDGLPSQPVEFGSFVFKMKDSVPPIIQAFLPSAGSGSVRLARVTGCYRLFDPPTRKVACESCDIPRSPATKLLDCSNLVCHIMRFDSSTHHNAKDCEHHLQREALALQGLTFMFSHGHPARVRKTEAFGAELTLVNLFGEPLAAPAPINLDSVNERLVKLDVEGRPVCVTW